MRRERFDFTFIGSRLARSKVIHTKFIVVIFNSDGNLPYAATPAQVHLQLSPSSDRVLPYNDFRTLGHNHKSEALACNAMD